MKLTIDRGALMKALSHVQNVVERRNTIPILSNVLIDAEGTSLRLTATDLDMEASDTTIAHIEKPGSITAPAQTLFDVVRKLPDGSDIGLLLDTETRRLTITSGRSRFALPTLPADDFQTMSKEEAPNSFEISASEFRRLIDKTKFAISTEETRYYLNGVFMQGTEVGGSTKLRTVATDGHRLALAETDAPKGAETLPGIIIPRKAVAEIRRLLDDAAQDSDVTVATSESKIVVKVGDAVITSKLIDGSFPDYTRVIPQSNEKILVLKNAEFKGAVDRVATVSAERSRSVKLTIENDKLVLQVSNAETGQGVEELEAQYNDEPLEIGFNARYLLDVTQQIEGDDIRFELNDGASSARVTDLADQAAQYVLMPLRV